MTSEVQDAAIAATVVLLRDRADGGALEVLLLHRPTHASMFAGMWVFPGGRVDAADGTGAEGLRSAAVREVAEESGVSIDAHDLVPLAYWEPPGTGRRYNTTFFIVRAGREEVRVDGTEVDDFMWIQPDVALDRHRVDALKLVVPTWMTLHSLARHATTDAALRHARENGRSTFRTHIRSGAEGDYALWEGDAAYESGDLDAVGGRFRLHTPQTPPWRLERS